MVVRRRGAYAACGPRPARLAVFGCEAPGLRRDVESLREPRVFHEGVSPSADGGGADRPHGSGSSEFAASEIRAHKGRVRADQEGGAAMRSNPYCGNQVADPSGPGCGILQVNLNHFEEKVVCNQM